MKPHGSQIHCSTGELYRVRRPVKRAATARAARTGRPGGRWRAGYARRVAPTPRRTDATPKRERIRQDVLRAMEELLTEGETYADMGVERLAGRAGISRTSFYFYFRDKREVLELLTAVVADELYAAADIWWSGTGVSHDALRTSIEDVSALFVQHGPLLRAIVEVGTYEREVAEHWRALIGRFVDATEGRILLFEVVDRRLRLVTEKVRARACVEGRT